ncbi:MAG TPA: hypothetical protein VKA76_07315 [Gammaproteobacteria bacterium]|nr:hypothetical protein [Gammaproteobacteria bacterium]
MGDRLRVGALHPSPSSKPTDRAPARGLLPVLALGAGAALLAGAFRWPLHVPGHQGLTLMAMLMFARCAWPRRWGATVFALGAMAVASTPLVHGHDPLVPLYYLTVGIAVDLLMGMPARLRRHGAVLGLVGALAYATKALLQWSLALRLGTVHAFAAFPFAHVLLAHLLFGFVGALVGAWAGTRTRHNL